MEKKVKLIIEIGEGDYEAIKNDGVQSHIALADEIIANGTPITEGDMISRSELKSHKFLSPQVKVVGSRHNGKTKEQIVEAYQKGWNDCIDAITDNAPTVAERPQGEWISVSERLPDTSGHKIVCFVKPQRIDNIYIGLAYFDKGRWVGYLKEDIVAWQPLPEPYKKGGAE